MTETSPQPDVAYRILSDRRRRIIVALLGAEEQAFTVSDLTKEIAVHEGEGSITECSEDELTRIYNSLHHVHVPKLADAGFVEYDPDRSIVEPTDRLDALEAFRQTFEEQVEADTESDLPPVP